MGSKKKTQSYTMPDSPGQGNAPRDAAERLSTRYQFRRDGESIGVPYSEWADLADHYWRICGRMGPAMPAPPTDKPDALPLYVDADLDALQGPQSVRLTDKEQSVCLWIYPKV